MIQKEELQAVYFGFYDQLNEPERSEAKENWDYKYCSPERNPANLEEAVIRGFGWEKTDQTIEYWDELYDSLRDGTYPSTGLSLTINSLTDSEVTAYKGINDELRKAEAKHPDWPTHDLYKQLAIITEEVGEVSRAIQNLIDGTGTIEELKEELHQSAAMHLRTLKHLKG